MLSHLVLGTTNSLYLGDMLFFALVFVLLMWAIKVVAWGPVTKMMKERADRISNDIDSAEKSRQDAEKLAQKREEALKNSHAEASTIVSNAKDNGAKQREQIVASAQQEAQSLKQNAQKDIEQERKDALKGAQNDVASLSIEIASKIIQKELNAQDQKQLIDSYIEGLGKQNESR
ncbi:F0F1 ATP synthase subunit B [Pediococcus ethanolidurans]|uniref:ATP synthase subunit b n=2 Tax=Pediococcus ethanolidurans TaxID=319653 RepID=A0A1H9S6Y7_9LACO|nr:F0F1 ATP synthase subunit B [Pediococcus ethanolidurans]GEN95683.1 ATP synthase subunit b [Pediococcus ethanolidurans]SER80730.1 F-type H+-transporting ATPase subunit b [Pediococcus ethanolidurans]